MSISDSNKDQGKDNGSHPDLQTFIATSISNSSRQPENNAASPNKIKTKKGKSPRISKANIGVSQNSSIFIVVIIQ